MQFPILLSLSVDNHQQMFNGFFEKLEKMQQLVSWIQGAMSLLEILEFYSAELFFGFLATIAPRTNEMEGGRKGKGCTKQHHIR